MFIEMWTDLEFDPRGDNPKNDIVNESHKLKDKTCPWIIPNGSPFKAGSVKITDAKGQNIKTGWTEVFEPMPLIEMTGQAMKCFIELDTTVLSLDEIVISYHSVGASFIPRNNLEEQLEAIEHGGAPIPWKKVIQIPDELPPSEHWHSKEELMDWTDLVLYMRYVLALAEKQSKAIQDIEVVYEKVREILDQLIVQYNLVNIKLINHGKDQNNPHKVTPLDLLLGNIDNFALATIQDDIDGVRSDLFSTSAGAITAIQSISPDTSVLMKNGTLPISSLKSEDYLPPVIDGSFEGLGTDNNCAAFCLESTGRLFSVKRHFDGRVKALYFSFNNNYRDPTSSFVFTGFRYTNAALTAQGYSLDTVMMGSGPDLMVVGDSAKGKWFGALTNGTLNPSTHTYKEFDLSNVHGISLSVGTFAHCFKTKNYIFIIGQSLDTSGDNNLYFYRAPLSDLNNKTVITFTPIKVSFTDLTGNRYTNSDYWLPDTISYDANGRITRYINTITPYANSIQIRYNGALFMAEESDDVELIKIIGRPLYRNDQTNWFKYVSFEMTIRLNCANGNITTALQQPIINLNANDGKSGGNEYMISDFAQAISGYNWGPYGGIVTRLGDYVALRDNGDHSYVPVGYAGMRGANQTAVQALLASTAKTDYAKYGWSWFNGVVVTQAPLQIGGGANTPVFDADGEWVPGLDINAQNYVMGFRKVTGGFALRPGLTNTRLNNLKGRPLVNSVYRTNLANGQTMACYSGTAAEISNSGVELGVSSLSNLAVAYLNKPWQSLHINANGIAKEGNGYMLCIRSYNRVFNDDDMTLNVVPVNYYGFSTAVLQQIKAMLGSDGPNANYIAFKINVPPKDINSNSLIAGQPVFVTAHWYSPVTPGAFRSQTLAVQMTVGGAVDVVYPMVSPVLLDITSVYNTPSGGNADNPNFYLGNGQATGHFQSYKNGSTITVKGMTGVFIAVSGGSTFHLVDVDFNLSTNKFTRNASANGSYTPQSSIVLIPKVGFANLYDPSYTGQAACIANTSDGPYLISSCYPETGWIVYFKAGTKLVINGTEYDAPTGTVDLRDIDPDPTNKTFYVYATCYGDESYYIVSGRRIRHNLSLIPAAKVVTNANQILTIERYSTFMIGDGILSSERRAGTIPLSIGLPMDEGTFTYVYQSDLPSK